MHARRIIAVSPDQAVGARLASALAGVGTVDVRATLALHEGPAALCVIHVEHAADARALLARVPADGSVIALAPRADLAAVVEIMEAAERVAGVLVAEDFDPRQLAAMAARVLTAERFGLEDVLAAGTEIHAEVIGDHADKSRCMARVAALVEERGIARRFHAAIEQCLDEMLMNALYDAPVDATGKRLFAAVPARTRVTLRTDQQVTVQYAFDGARFALSVRDAFGTLDRPTVLRYLHKCLHSSEQVDRKAGGAGVGLYLMLTASSAVYFSVVPGVATEAICVFEIATPSEQLERFGFFQGDAAGRTPTAARRLPAAATVRRRRVRLGIAASVTALLVVLGIVAWPRLFGPTTAHVTFTTIPAGATVELEGRVVGVATGGTLTVRDLAIGRAYPVVARLDAHDPAQLVVRPEAGGTAVTIELRPLPMVELESEPSDAAVTIDGAAMGSTPLRLTSLPPGATVTIAFEKPGYQRATAKLQVPPRGEVERLVQPLARSEDYVRVRFVSNPPGAEVVREGQAASATDRTYTPADVFVEAGKVQRFTLTMPRHVPLVIAPFTVERGAESLEKGGDLVPGATLRVEGAAGTVTVANAPHCTAVAVPAACTLAPGTYAVSYRGADGTAASRTVMVSTRDVVERFEPAPR